MHLQLYGKKIWVYRKNIDFRLAIDGLSAFVANNIHHSPKTGIYLFFNKKRDRIKLLSWHKNGFAMVYKRIEIGKFIFEFSKEKGVLEMNIEELGWMLAGLDWQRMSNWRELSYDQFS